MNWVIDKLGGKIALEVYATANRLAQQYQSVTRERLEALLCEQAVTEIRRADGQDVGIAEAALASAWGSMERQQAAALRLEARELAWRVVVAALRLGAAV